MPDWGQNILPLNFILFFCKPLAIVVILGGQIS
jgi:hypothetical protein